MIDAEKVITEFLRERLSVTVDNNFPPDADPAWANYAEVRDMDGNRVGFIHMDDIERLLESRDGTPTEENP